MNTFQGYEYKPFVNPSERGGMREHHRQALQALVEYAKERPEIEAVITAGSLANHRALENSDLDVFFVVSEEEYACRKERRELYYSPPGICSYPDGYVDGKVITHRFMQDAAEYGTEPTRAAFIGSEIAYSQIDGLERLLQRIPVYPVHDKQRRLNTFYAQTVLLGRYFIKQAYKMEDPYLLWHTASDTVLFAGRLILAWNERLFPGHKWFLHEVDMAPDKPERFMELAYALLRDPSWHNMKYFMKAVDKFQDWGVTMGTAVSTFMEVNEWNWRDHRLSPAEW